ncbi:MAG: peptide ABC transporter substrate-binding protein [Candidatus Moraniibacteriota bacterium]
MASTTPTPDYGGEYSEGIVAQPRYLNPLLSQTSEADADLVQLIYSGLFAPDEQGKLVPRVAEKYEVSEDGKVYTVTLRQGVSWHDGEELTADDVLYTVQTIQDPGYKSPLRPNWLSVETAVIDRYTVQFTLKRAYAGFLQNLSVGILPKHIWQSIPADRFLLTDYNLAPIGSGPYIYDDATKDSSGNILSIDLKANKEYFEGAPYISTFVFRFYPDDESLLEAYRRKEVLALNSIHPGQIEAVMERKSSRLYEIDMPRIFEVFLNRTKSKALAYAEVRQALAFATDRDAVVREALAGKAAPAQTAFMPFMAGFASDLPFPGFDQARANKILDDAGWKKEDDGIRQKDRDTPLEFAIDVPNWPELVRSADIVKGQWEALGARVSINVLEPLDLQKNVLRTRDYQALLYGQASMLESDPYSFWHSSQREDPGLNLSLFESGDADGVLESLREERDENKRRDLYRQFQEILIEENPTVFLYSPKYLFVASDQIKGVGVTRLDNPENRFTNANKWYIYTDRVWKK